MLSKYLKIILIVLIVIILISAISLVFYPSKTVSYKNQNLDEKGDTNLVTGTTVPFGSLALNMWYAENFEDRARGYSGTPVIPTNEGLVFVFEVPGRWSMWMKDMLVPIDIVWLDAQGKVVHIETGVATSTYPHEAFTPSEDSVYVIEVASGTVAISGIKKGDMVPVKGTQGVQTE